MIRRMVPAVVLCMLALVSTARAVEDQYFDSNGVKIHYIVEGKGEPVILIHGFTASIPVQWGTMINNLAQDYQVIAIDNRGHGKSGKPHDPKQYGLEMPGDVLRLMDHLGIKKAHVVGYSMGGFITGNLLATHPERLISATLGGAGWAKADDERLSFMNELADSLENGKGIGPLINHLTPPGQPKPNEEQIQAINSMLMIMNDQKALAACIRGMKALAVPEEKLAANKVPTLALIGEIDPLKSGVDEMQSRMKNLRVEVIEGADHMTAFRNVKFINDLREFLAAHSTVKAAAAAAAN